MEAKNMDEDTRFALFSGIMLKRSLQLSRRILAMTVAICIVAVFVTALPDTSRLLKLIMASNALLMVWGNRRAIMESRRNRNLLADSRIANERRTVVSTMKADWAALCIATATSLYLFWAAMQGAPS